MCRIDVISAFLKKLNKLMQKNKIYNSTDFCKWLNFFRHHCHRSYLLDLMVSTSL